MKRFVYLACFVAFVVFAPSVFASSDFTTGITSVYEVAKDNDTKVTHTIELKNNTPTLYATNYSMSVSGDITKLLALDELGVLHFTEKKDGNSTLINIDINKPAIGKEQTKILTISYSTPDVLETLSNTLSINIPRINQANEAQSYRRIIKVKNPVSEKSIIYPQPSSYIDEGEYSVYTFDGYPTETISLLFGEAVNYKLNLTYELINNDFSTVDSELALPPDTGYQHMILDSIDPVPSSITTDIDGNWLARYTLKPKEKLNIRLTMYARVYPSPTQYDPGHVTEHALSPTKYWDSNSTTVIDLAKKLKTPEFIYKYLVENLTYSSKIDSSSKDRKSSSQVILSPHNVLCTEYTDSFVGLARAAKIPAREINGYGYPSKSLHSYPEYFDESQNRWISIDPTWGSTTGGVDYLNKLDFSHITFVRHGKEDSYPLPAGVYKDSKDSSNINVEVVDNLPGEKISKEVRGNIVYNTGNVAIHSDEYGYIPPYGSKKLKKSPTFALYDKIKKICENLLSIF